MPPAPTLATATLTLAPPTPTLATATRSPAPPAPSVVARTATPGANPPLTAVAQTPAPLQGLFRAEGDAARATVIYSVGDSPSNALQVPLPWSMAFETLPGAELLLVVTDEDEGAVRCEIVVGGAVLQTEAQPSGQGEAACVADAPLQ
ncbi:MAG: rane protein [Chloroflexota bacterium]